MKKTEYITSLLKSKTDLEIKTMVEEHQILQNTGILPESSSFREFGYIVASTFEVGYNINLTEAFLTKEVFDRFVKMV